MREVGGMVSSCGFSHGCAFRNKEIGGDRGKEREREGEGKGGEGGQI